MSQPGPQAAGPPRQVSASELRPGRWWYFVALGIFVVCGIVGGVVAAFLFSNAAGATDLQDVTSRQQQVEFAADEQKVLYVSGGASAVDIPVCRHQGPGRIEVSRLNGSSTITVNDQTWRGVANLSATQAGTYTVTCQAPTGGRVAIGKNAVGVVGNIFGGLGAVFGGILLGLLLGGIVAIITLVRRSNHKKSLQTAAPGGFPGAPFGGPQPPQPGQPQPPQFGQPQPGQPPQFGQPGQPQPPQGQPQPGQPQPGQPPQPQPPQFGQPGQPGQPQPPQPPQGQPPQFGQPPQGQPPQPGRPQPPQGQPPQPAQPQPGQPPHGQPPQPGQQPPPGQPPAP